MAVRAKTGEILGIQCAQLGYKGPLAAMARQKYGHREDKSASAVQAVLETVRSCGRSELKVVTDANPQYRLRIPKTLPNATHTFVKRCVEKTDRKNKDDALFTLNYTAAKIRNDLSRMARKTWIITKKIERLQAHMDLYIAWNNGYRLTA